MARPGIMIYFDLLGPIKKLPDADKGRLLVAMLEYGKSGIRPAFDGMLALVWEFVRPKLDKDEQEYNLSVQRRQYATFCRERKRNGEPVITFDEWLKISSHHDNHRLSMMTNDDQWYPTTTTTTTTSTSTTTTPTTTTSQRSPEADFAQIWDLYPADRRGNRQMAIEAFRMDITSEDEADTAIENLKLWKQSEQWTKKNGQFIPYLDNWLSRGAWRTKPKKIVSSGNRELDDEEREAIRRMLGEGSE